MFGCNKWLKCFIRLKTCFNLFWCFFLIHLPFIVMVLHLYIKSVWSVSCRCSRLIYYIYFIPAAGIHLLALSRSEFCISVSVNFFLNVSGRFTLPPPLVVRGFGLCQLLYCSQVGFGWALFDRWITACGHLVVVRMMKSRFDEARVTELRSGLNDASVCSLDKTGLHNSFIIFFDLQNLIKRSLLLFRRNTFHKTWLGCYGRVTGNILVIKPACNSRTNSPKFHHLSSVSDQNSLSVITQNFVWIKKLL